MSRGINKQQVGFKFGKHRLTVLRTCGEIGENGRKYRLVRVQTHDGLKYYSLRLYNSTGKFIKQFLFEPKVLFGFIGLFMTEGKQFLEESKG